MILDEPSDNFAVLSSLGLLDDEHDKQPATRPEKPPNTEYGQLTSEELVHRLTNIKKRIDHLRLVFSTSLSREISSEIDAWRSRFKALADALLQKPEGAELLYSLIRGCEDFFLSEPKPPTKPVVPLSVQRMAELVWQIRQMPEPERPKTDGFADGLGAFVS